MLRTDSPSSHEETASRKELALRLITSHAPIDVLRQIMRVNKQLLAKAKTTPAWEKYFAQLKELINRGDNKALSEKLKSEFPVNLTDAQGKTLLHYACSLPEEKNKRDQNILLIQHGAKIDIPDEAGEKPKVVPLESLVDHVKDDLIKAQEQNIQRLPVFNDREILGDNEWCCTVPSRHCNQADFHLPSSIGGTVSLLGGSASFAIFLVGLVYLQEKVVIGSVCGLTASIFLGCLSCLYPRLRLEIKKSREEPLVIAENQQLEDQAKKAEIILQRAFYSAAPHSTHFSSPNPDCRIQIESDEIEERDEAAAENLPLISHRKSSCSIL